MASQSEKSTVHQIFHVLLAVLGVTLIGAFIFCFDYGKNLYLKIFGTLLLFLAAFLGWFPVYIFKKKGGVPKGKGFVETTKLVTSGAYSIVRHPQYLAGMLVGFSLILISQHWLILVLGIPFMLIFYIAALDEEKYCIDKFGDSYKEYMKRVPRVNFIVGMIRHLFKTS